MPPMTETGHRYTQQHATGIVTWRNCYMDVVQVFTREMSIKRPHSTSRLLTGSLKCRTTLSAVARTRIPMTMKGSLRYILYHKTDTLTSHGYCWTAALM